LLTKPIVPLLAAVTAALLSLVPPERGGIRILQAIWLAIARDNVLLAAVIHAGVIGGLSFAIFFVARRVGNPIVGNIVCAVFLLAYTIAFFNLGVPMVA
jgi:hypothetical protein